MEGDGIEGMTAKSDFDMQKKGERRKVKHGSEKKAEGVDGLTNERRNRLHNEFAEQNWG